MTDKKVTEEKEPLTAEGLSDLLEGVYDYNSWIANNVRLANDRCIAYVKQGKITDRNKRYLVNKLADAKKKIGFIETALAEAIEGIETL